MTIENVGLERLALAPENPRQNVETSEVESLAASIYQTGLIHCLAGYRGEGDDDMIYIVAGGRRMRALLKLHAENMLNGLATEGIPVAVIDRSLAGAVALAENEERAELKPHEEILAFRVLRESGHSAEDISDMYRTPISTVRRRLALGGLPDKIVGMIADGRLSMGDATELASLPPEVIEANTDALAEGKVQYWKIYNDFTEGRISDASRYAKLVGVERYREAGGTLTLDMIEGDSWFDNPELLRQKAQEILQERADALDKEWAEVLIEPVEFEGYGQRYDPGPRRPITLTKPPRSKDGVVTFTKKQKAHCIIHIGVSHDGTIWEVAGLGWIAKDKIDSAIEAGLYEKPAAGSPAAGPDPEGLSKKGAIETVAIVRQAVAAELATNGKYMLDTLAWGYACSRNLTTPPCKGLLNGAPSQDSPFDFDGAGSVAIKVKRPDEPYSSYEDFIERTTPKARQALAALAISGRVNHHLPSLIDCGAIAVLRRHWTPDANWLAGLKTAGLKRIMTDCGCAEHAKGKSKQGLVDWLAAAFSKKKGAVDLAPEQRLLLDEWVPHELRPDLPADDPGEPEVDEAEDPVDEEAEPANAPA